MEEVVGIVAVIIIIIGIGFLHDGPRRRPYGIREKPTTSPPDGRPGAQGPNSR